MDRYGFNQLDVMRDSGVSNSVLCLWLQRKYRGDNRKVASRLQNWMISVQRREERRQALAAGGGVTEAALAAVPGGTLAAAASATPRAVPLYAYAPVSSYGHGTSSKHSQHVLHEHLVPIRLHHTLPAERPAASAAAASIHSSSSAAAAAAVPPADSAARTYSDCFLWNLFEQQLSPRAFLSQTLADESMDVSRWLTPLLQQMQQQLAHFVATEPQRRENLEEWPQLMQQYGVAPNSAAATAPAVPAATAAGLCGSAPAAAAAAASSSSSPPSSSPSASAPAALMSDLDDRPPSAVVAAVRGLPPDRAGMLPTFVCGAVSSVPVLAARDPANNFQSERNRRAAAQAAGSSSSSGAAMVDSAGESSASTVAAASSASPSTAVASPDVSLLHQDPAGHLSRQPTPQLVKLKFDLTHNGTHLLYHVLWDPSNPHCIPEDLARVVCKELGLSGDFAALMAWSAREQLERDERLQAQQPGRVEGCLLRVPFPPAGEALFRAEAAARDFGPIVRSVPPARMEPQQPQPQQQRAVDARMEDAAAAAPSSASNGAGGDVSLASLSGLKRKSAGGASPALSSDFAATPSAEPMRDDASASASSPDSNDGADNDLGAASPSRSDNDSSQVARQRDKKQRLSSAAQQLLDRSGVLDDTAASASASSSAAAAASFPMTPLSGHGSSGASRFGLSLFSPGGPGALPASLSAAGGRTVSASSSSSAPPMAWPPVPAASDLSPPLSASLNASPPDQQLTPPAFTLRQSNTPSPRML